MTDLLAEEFVNPDLTENQIKTACIDYLILTGFLVIRINSGGMSGEYTDAEGQTRRRWYWFSRWFAGGLTGPHPRGVADTIAIKPGCAPLAIEYKLPGKELRPEQRLFINQWRAHGGIGLVISHLGELVRALEDLDKEGIE